MAVIHDLSAAIFDSTLLDDEVRDHALTIIQETTYSWATMPEFESAVERYLAAYPHNIVPALSELIPAPTLARLANEVAEDEQFCPTNASPIEAANRFLEAIGVPTVLWNSDYRGIEHIQSRVNREERKLRRRRRSRRKMNGVELSHWGIVVWKEVEALLKVCTRFYAMALSQLGKPGVNRFNRLDRSMNLGGILWDIWNLEQGLGDQTKQECHYLIERPSPFQGLLDQPHTLNLTTKEEEWLEEYERKTERLQQTMQNYAGPYWGEVFMTDVQVYRNFYAHRNEDAVLAAGPDKATRSFQAAKRMLNYMLSEQVAKGDLVPRLVIPVEQGFDHLGRQTVRLVASSDLEDDGTYLDPSITPIYRLPEWDRNLPELKLFRFYLCCPFYELALNPVLIPLEDIQPETLREEE